MEVKTVKEEVEQWLGEQIEASRNLYCKSKNKKYDNLFYNLSGMADYIHVNDAKRLAKFLGIEDLEATYDSTPGLTYPYRVSFKFGGAIIFSVYSEEV